MRSVAWLLLLLLLFGLAVLAARAAPVPLLGLWRNQLGSVMTITNVDGDGGFQGVYHRAVGRTPGTMPLAGRYHTFGNHSVVGWTVAWKYAGGTSVTAWSGQYFGGAPEEIHTTWLLTEAVATLQDSWGATRTSVDLFVRQAK
jgi:hypothetical protein